MFATVAHIAAILVSAVFAVAALVYVGIALYHSATTPRVSFSDSYADDDADPAVDAPDPGIPGSARSVD